jgi:nucleotide-binding universal stress UspA family protein
MAAMPPTDPLRQAKPFTILAAADLRDLYRLAPHALHQAEQSGARLILLHVVTPSESTLASAPMLAYYAPGHAEELASLGLGFWTDFLDRQGVSAKPMIAEGPAAEQIAAIAEETNAGWILLGTHRHGVLSKLLIGSVAERLLNSLDLPILTIGPETEPPAREADRAILHAVSLRPGSRQLAAIAAELARSRNARLQLLHVLPPVEEWDGSGMNKDLADLTRQKLEQLACELGEHVEPRLRQGDAAWTILAEAAATNAAMIVLGRTRRSLWADLAQERTVSRVLAHARRPVLTLRSQEEPAGLF